MGGVARVAPREDETEDRGVEQGEGAANTLPALHPLVPGLFGALPEPGTPFDDEDRAVWLRAADLNLTLIYGR